MDVQTHILHKSTHTVQTASSTVVINVIRVNKMHTHLVFLEPLLQQLLAALLQHWTTQLERLVLIELSLVQKNAEVRQQRWCLALLRRHLLEPLNCLRCSQYSLRHMYSRPHQQQITTVSVMFTYIHNTFTTPSLLQKLLHLLRCYPRWWPVSQAENARNVTGLKFGVNVFTGSDWVVVVVPGMQLRLHSAIPTSTSSSTEDGSESNLLLRGA